MPDNRFEHQLQEQMGEFHFTPSEAVWQKLEAELIKRKKRRRAIFWFFSGLLVFSAGLYFYAPKDELQADSIKTFQKKTVSLAQQSSPVKQPAETAPIAQQTAMDDQPVSVKKDAVENTAVNKKAQGQKREAAPEVKEIDSALMKLDIIDDVQTIPALTMVDQQLSEKPALVFEHDPFMNASNGLEQNSNRREADSAATIINHTITHLPKRPLRFGLRLEAGSSANHESGFMQTKSADLNSSPLTGGSPSSINIPYSHSPAFAWSAGAWMRKPFSDKLSLVSGLTYHHYRTGTPVGSGVAAPAQISYRAMDITVDQYYTQGNAQTFQNNYHLLSVPLEISLQLNKGRNIPIEWMAGLEPGWMVSSNALVKDSSGILYSDKAIFNRFQLGLQTGFSFRFFNKTSRPVYVGPVFQYMLTPSFKNGDLYNGHLSFIGLRADWLLFSSRAKQR